MQLATYLNFDGTCREAMTFYAETFGAEIRSVSTFADLSGGAPPGGEDRILNMQMTLGGHLVMGSDTPPGRPVAHGGFALTAGCADEAEARAAFAALSEGGEVTMPLGPTFWSSLFGMCTDRFGVAWMVNTGPA